MLLQRCYNSLILCCMILMPVSFAMASESPMETRTLLTTSETYAEDMVHTALTQDVTDSHKLYKSIQKNMKQLHLLLAKAPFNERNSRELLMAYSWMRVIAIDMKQNAWIGTAKPPIS